MREVDPYGPNYAKLESLYRNHPLLRNRQKHLNYYAVTALLARVQLYAGNLPDALEAAREIVGEPGSEPVAPFSLTTAAATMSVYSTVSCCLLWRKGKCRIISMFISGSRL